jgi:hypothetical protein
LSQNGIQSDQVKTRLITFSLQIGAALPLPSSNASLRESKPVPLDTDRHQELVTSSNLNDLQASGIRRSLLGQPDETRACSNLFSRPLPQDKQ